MNSIGGKFKDINCATINVNSDFKNHNSSTYLSVYGKARGVNYSIPATTIEILFVRYAGSGRRLQYKININPVHYGFYSEGVSNGNFNEWSKLLFLKDEGKKKFIRDLSLWAVDVQKRMDRAFSGDLNAFSEVPKFSYYLNKDNIKNLTQEGVEEKLRMLKNLYGKELINEKQYNEQVKNILNQK
jgi:hypothetical protein